MSKLETNTIDNISGSSTLNIGDTNATSVTIDSGVSTFTIPNGAATGQNYPAFFASLSADQTGLTSGSTTKVQFNTEAFDTDNIYDNSTNYRITIPSGKEGKYYIEASVLVDSLAVSNFNRGLVYLYKNGSSYIESFQDFRNNPPQKNNIQISAMMDLAVGDYIEIFTYSESVNSGNLQIRGDALEIETWFQGFRIGA